MPYLLPFLYDFLQNIYSFEENNVLLFYFIDPTAYTKLSLTGY